MLLMYSMGVDFFHQKQINMAKNQSLAIMFIGYYNPENIQLNFA